MHYKATGTISSNQLKAGDIRTWIKEPTENAIHILKTHGSDCVLWDFEVISISEYVPYTAYCSVIQGKNDRMRHAFHMLVEDVLLNSVAKL